MRRSLSTLALIALCCTAIPAHAQTEDPDRDGDGLSDFREIHKYRTDPKKADSDGDGIPDGDWQERREWTYSIRVVIQVRPPYDKATLEDDYQDARVLFECEEYGEIEFVLYPLNTVAEAIEGQRNWRKGARRFKEFVAPGTTTNWDATMRKELHRDLGKSGIDVRELTDADLATKVSRWALEHAPSLNRTCVWAVAFEDGKPSVPDSLRGKFDSNKGDAGWSDQDQFDRELYGAGMYRNKSRGTCTTSANYLTTVLRAVDMPTRMILTIPVVDGSDARNVEMLKRLTHPVVRRDVTTGVTALQNSFAAHTYNEVLVDGRWHRLNYNRLGQNILDPDYMGLMVRVHTFKDLADAGLGKGWGLRKNDFSHVFKGNNPYTTVTLSDGNGPHSTLEIPSVKDAERRWLTVTEAFWFHSDQRPAGIGAGWHGAQQEGAGHLLVRVKESGRDFQTTWKQAGRTLELRADGEAVATVHTTGNWWPGSGGRPGISYMRISPSDFQKLQPGARYTLVPVHTSEDFRWRVEDDIVIRGPK